MNEQEFPQGSVPVAVAARVYGKDASWVRAGIVSGWLPIGKATRSGKLVTTIEEMDSRYCLPKYAAKAGSTGSNTTTPPSNGSASKPASAKKAAEAARSFNKTLAGTYVVTANVGLHIRNGAGTGKASLAVLPKGTKVANYGYYTLVGNIKWLYVQVTYKGVTYTGFCSSQYLKK